MATDASQTLQRGLDLIEAVARGEGSLAALVAATGLTQSTAHRLASVLVARRYLAPVPRGGYRLGASALKIGVEARRQLDFIRIARPHLEELARVTTETASLAVRDGDSALLLDEAPGWGPILVSRRIGERLPLDDTSLGRALILGSPSLVCGIDSIESKVRCIAAPVLDAAGAIVAAIGISGVSEAGGGLCPDPLPTAVRAAADAISRELGGDGDQRIRIELLA